MRSEESRIQNRDYMRRRRAADPEGARARLRDWYRANPEKWREYSLIRKYGLTNEMFAEYLDAQEGACAFCGQELPLDVRKVHVDHDHKTGEFRGLVHALCNQSIGHAERDDNFVGYMAANRIGEVATVR